MYGATPRCPRCEKLVYAAEQILGPGRKFYHKFCLKCTTCGRRLDSYTLLEHDEEPYCKACHLKNFGTTNLRHANLPYAARPRGDSVDDASLSPPTSPSRVASINTEPNGIPRLRPTRVLSPTSSNFPRPGSRPGSSSGRRNSPTISPPVTPPEEPVAEEGDTSIDSSREDESVISTSTDPTSTEGDEEEAEVSPVDRTKPPIPTNTGRPGLGTLPRTVALSFDHSSHVRPSTPPRHKSTVSLGSISETAASGPEPPSSFLPSTPPFSSSNRATPAAAALNLLQQEGIDYPSPLRRTPTGSKYGNALAGGVSPQTTGTRYGAALNAPVAPQVTGTRYGAALSGGIGVQTTGSPRKWGTSTPQCPKCSKSVYFAEQVKAVGKTYHKHCLRCTECGTTLDSTKLRDHDEEPFCVRCYNKLYGPQGGGYALLGKAGG